MKVKHDVLKQLPLSGVRVCRFYLGPGPGRSVPCKLAHLGAEVIRIESGEAACASTRRIPPGCRRGKPGRTAVGILISTNQGKTLDLP